VGDAPVWAAEKKKSLGFRPPLLVRLNGGKRVQPRPPPPSVFPVRFCFFLMFPTPATRCPPPLHVLAHPMCISLLCCPPVSWLCCVGFYPWCFPTVTRLAFGFERFRAPPPSRLVSRSCELGALEILPGPVSLRGTVPPNRKSVFGNTARPGGHTPLLCESAPRAWFNPHPPLNEHGGPRVVPPNSKTSPWGGHRKDRAGDPVGTVLFESKSLLSKPPRLFSFPSWFPGPRFKSPKFRNENFYPFAGETCGKNLNRKSSRPPPPSGKRFR